MPKRLYWEDSFSARFEAQVTGVRQQPAGSDGPLWQLALDQTAFYPTGGGQPCDLGTLISTSPDGEILNVPVLAAEQDETGEIWHTTTKALPAGTSLRGEIDFARRLDHVQQHSGQHLVSAVFLRRMKAATVSFHLGEDGSTIDLGIAHATPDELAQVEDEANGLIAEDRPVTSRFVPHAQAAALFAAGQLHKLPHREGDIRLVEIAGVELNACGGTHVRSTGQIGGLLIRGTERVRQNLRVAFVCGLRAVHAARADFAAIHQAASLLSVGGGHLAEAAERLASEQKSAAKERQRLREQLAEAEAALLLAQTGDTDRLKIIRRIFPDRDAEHVKLLASKIAAAAPSACALLATTAAVPAKVFAARSPDLPIDCGAIFKEKLAAFGGRGGGGPSAAQAQLPGSHVGEFLDEVERILQTAAAPHP